MSDVICCNLCSYTSDKIYNVLRHLKGRHKATNDSIEQFKEQVSSSRAMEKYDAGVWKCDRCGRTVPTKHGLETHIATKHKKIVDPAAISLLESPTLVSPPPKVCGRPPLI
uniref:C2H2-type domain-containing protein n=1 Tax=Caenorhabditis japonica TaxID=281687 RepID=A0A8R1E7P5_CAEJA